MSCSFVKDNPIEFQNVKVCLLRGNLTGYGRNMRNKKLKMHI